MLHNPHCTKQMKLFFNFRLLYRISRHPGARWRARLVAGCAVLYLCSPVQLIPTFIPVIGQLDDVLVLYFGIKLAVRMVPQSVLAECMQSRCNQLMRSEPCPRHK
jgi:uncharacterized membrane protein YkvA (DUF1232 family)